MTRTFSFPRVLPGMASRGAGPQGEGLRVFMVLSTRGPGVFGKGCPGICPCRESVFQADPGWVPELAVAGPVACALDLTCAVPPLPSHVASFLLTAQVQATSQGISPGRVTLGRGRHLSKGRAAVSCDLRPVGGGWSVRGLSPEKEPVPPAAACPAAPELHLGTVTLAVPSAGDASLIPSSLCPVVTVALRPP